MVMRRLGLAGFPCAIVRVTKTQAGTRVVGIYFVVSLVLFSLLLICLFSLILRLFLIFL